VKTPLSIRTQLTLSHVILVTVTFAFIGLLFLNHEQAEIMEELQVQMLDRVEALAAAVEDDPDFSASEEFLVLQIPEVSLKASLTATYIDPAGTVHNLTSASIPGYMQTSMTDLHRDAPLEEGGLVEIVNRPGQPEHMYAVAQVHTDAAGDGGLACLFLPLKAVRSFIAWQRINFAGLILGLALLGGLASVLITRPIVARTADVRQLTHTVMQARYQMHVPETGPREVREISRYLNEMVDRLDEQQRARRTILSNVAHEMARPLTGLRLAVESLQKGALDSPEITQDLLKGMTGSVQQMEMLLDDIALAVTPLQQQVRLHRVYISVEPFLEGLASRFWTTAELRGLKIHVNVPPDLPQVFADERRLSQILGNLLDNAIKFTPRHGTITISARAGADNTVQLLVKDEGPGIPEDELQDLFEPFYQGVGGLQIKQGMGLGLSIARQLARLHGGDLELTSPPAGGTLAILTLPAENT
jgi:two-component system sensor histidine kinase BaeS